MDDIFSLFCFYFKIDAAHWKKCLQGMNLRFIVFFNNSIKLSRPALSAAINRDFSHFSKTAAKIIIFSAAIRRVECFAKESLVYREDCSPNEGYVTPIQLSGM
ncbi:hypothetical protein AAHN93_14195 [Vandammella animalimorsus]|uniref:hypothetical protein n=1 Tax=Vandammella animalimorsus TaxID=2029117 RepID=UPI0031B9CC1C